MEGVGNRPMPRRAPSIDLDLPGSIVALISLTHPGIEAGNALQHRNDDVARTPLVTRNHSLDSDLGLWTQKGEWRMVRFHPMTKEKNE